ncbi:MAG: hypothetical protein ACYC64_10070, partial [Armatimonadota bacterium]
MKKPHLCFAAVIVTALLAGGTLAATTVWLSTGADGTPTAENSITVMPGATVKLYAFLDSSDVGNTFELMVGYDTSNASTYGSGVDTNDGASKKLTLSSTKAEIMGSVPASFDVFTTSIYADKAVLLDTSGREEMNGDLAGRPYGFVGRAATRANAAPGMLRCFSFTLQNNMTTSGDTQYVVLSNVAGRNSYSDAWKYGTSLFEDSCALLVVNGE